MTRTSSDLPSVCGVRLWSPSDDEVRGKEIVSSAIRRIETASIARSLVAGRSGVASVDTQVEEAAGETTESRALGGSAGRRGLAAGALTNLCRGRERSRLGRGQDKELGGGGVGVHGV
ncbi:hypothetical protein ALUC_10317S [Aspergillus luchuensis]|nr:hypothetical protein ALUC_10317S [Aspergillus luchuensis]